MLCYAVLSRCIPVSLYLITHISQKRKLEMKNSKDVAIEEIREKGGGGGLGMLLGEKAFGGPIWEGRSYLKL